MNRYPMWKNILVLVALMLGLLYSMPNLFGESPAVQVTSTKATNKLDAAMLQKVENVLKLANVPFEALYLDARLSVGVITVDRVKLIFLNALDSARR